MFYLKLWFVLCSIVVVLAKLSDNSDSDEGKRCPRSCSGKEYECIDGDCYCAEGYVPNFYYNRCLKCPQERERCFGICCGENSDNVTLTCWQGFCRYCTDANNNWICTDTLDNVFLISSTQIAMATALIMGIIAMFILMYKMCAVPNLRPYGARSSTEGRLSVGSLQLYIEERLRDAPPRYSRTSPSTTPAIIPATVYLNAGFLHDSSIPPPPYTPQKEENQNTTVHI